MNLFFLSRDPVKCARFHCDKHVVKMILETAQMLSTAHRIIDGSDHPLLYRATHANHPSAIWIRETRDNYAWALALMKALNAEYMTRYGRSTPHKSMSLLPILGKPPRKLKARGFSSPPQCVPDDCKQRGTVAAYRAYYRNYKSRFAVWAYSKTPNWFLK